MHEQTMEQLWSTSQLAGGNVAYIEELYEAYLRDPSEVSEEWRSYFDQLPRVDEHVTVDIPHSPIRDQFLLISQNQRRARPVSASSVSTEHERKQVQVLQLINAYRGRGHQHAKLDPLGLMARQQVPDLDLHFHGLSKADLDTRFQTGSLFIGQDEATLKEIIDALETTYCGTIGAEFMHIVNTAEQRWFQQRLESARAHPKYSNEVKLHLLERLTAAEGLEKYLGSRYPGVKRFGLEGGESLIPLMDEIIQRCGSYGTKEIVIGMAHRGRLNTLINTLGKKTSDLFNEFDGKVEFQSHGDVKYHQGFSSNVMTSGGEVHLAMAFNPSHLEIVSPVVEGSVRARQDRRGDVNRELVVPITIHGDSAFAGQGVVMETFQLSQTRAYCTGGTIRIVINNQVGFTTSKREDVRSTEYCTDVAKMIEAPILHVNGDDPEAVLFAAQLATDYRREFRKDVVIDLVCYRRRGHNEADEPSGTQPLMYAQIKKQKTTRSVYAEKLIADGVLTLEHSKELEEDYRKALDEGRHVVKSLVKEPNKALFVDWTPFLGHEWTADADTSFDLPTLQDLANRLLKVPEGFALQPQVGKILEDRARMAAGAAPINWGFAETMAYATLLHEGYGVRITGQDVGRGTFSHRHAVLHNQKDATSYVPLANISPDQPKIAIYDSLLSEEAVLAFEYGYSTTTPGSLVIWEAQFGDFANGAQVVFDQFISSGEHKWGRLCGLTMLLPHGYEGQGPEHSSARLERYLQLCAEHNVQICVPSTPAQVYHMLRRQIIRPLRKPLVVMSPKSLLRHKLAISTLEDLAHGSFQTVINEIDELNPADVRRVLLCSGKVYYDLLERRRNENIKDIAIVRIEQLYPFPEDDLTAILAQYPNMQEVFWVQEEPMNMGAWYNSQHHMIRVIQKFKPGMALQYAGREASASPAAGYMALHLKQLEQYLRDALDIQGE
ncbi:2-oxoglutarate dehydrogenase E1 component [Parathalassolituus penaei]|uniref:2-oxoglutarate dehydrogenase E1 component n=1 Tax=Parathalassolituus penaei TaxID=2997323 RepID=A0A9X3EFH3_9GAMM|nr:2-oxoglutarate dehydrogenase E1 component [Parathalassolituus penaei]MCY0966582.1 2-oxoglutarate dehydrogenase E1 component [Parathalassolituus penaei]